MGKLKVVSFHVHPEEQTKMLKADPENPRLQPHEHVIGILDSSRVGGTLTYLVVLLVEER